MSKGDRLKRLEVVLHPPEKTVIRVWMRDKDVVTSGDEVLTAAEFDKLYPDAIKVFYGSFEDERDGEK